MVYQDSNHRAQDGEARQSQIFGQPEIERRSLSKTETKIKQNNK